MRELLQIFIDKEEIRDWMHSPFTIGNFSYATNGIFLVRIPKISGVEELTGFDPKRILKMFPTDFNQNTNILIEDFQDAFKNAHVVPERVLTYDKCVVCNGEGEVEWEFERWTRYDECPKCDGDGESERETLTGREIMQPDALIQIGGSYFKLECIEQICKAAEILKADTLKVLRMDATNSSFYRLGEMEILMASFMAKSAIEESDKYPTIKTFNLNSPQPCTDLQPKEQ